MIRPVTLLCASAFAFSGFHLYQTKHRAQEVDRAIVRTMGEVTRAHNHAVLLRAEYALLNDPTRLQDLAEQYLTLRPTAPGQFVAMADLASRLPPVGPAPDANPDATPTDSPDAAPLVARAAPDATPTPDAVPAPPAASPPPAPAVVAEAPRAQPQAMPQPQPAPAPHREPRPQVVIAANPPAPPRPVAPVRPPVPHREAPAPTPLHPTPLHPQPVRASVHVAPRPPVVVAQRPRADVPPPPVRARYEPPPGYAGAPVRPMGGSVLGMAYTGFPSGGGR